MEDILKPSNLTAVRVSEELLVSVWLVEDNHSYRRNVARALSRVDGLDCSQRFSNAEDMLKALTGGSVPDVILLDVGLPGQDGIAAVRRIKSICPSTHVVMLTVFEDHEKVFKAVCAGASGYLLKTAPVERIVESIREAMSGGAPMSPSVAKSVLKMFSELTRHDQDYGLTAREQNILELLTQGLIKKEIADKLVLSYHTVDTHLRNIYIKLQVHSATGAVAKAVREHLF